jgi:plasmid maintenance system antidote protein VapI
MQRDLTQRELCKLLHENKEFVGLIERGKKPITEEIAWNLERVFGVYYKRFLE